ncbi:MAG: DsbA family oxidoreductase [Anaerolineae bacterium]|nr:DsbA family oxidoreductase [Anaerolineae bacterium]
MKVEIWSDIACPWCYIGRRRFEAALRQFEHRDQVTVTWRSFELDPNAAREYPGSINDMLVERKGWQRSRVEAMHDHITELAAAEGLEYNFDRMRVGNSFDAHRLIHLAAHHGLQSEMKERIQRAYFTEGQSFGNVDALVQLASDVGLDAAEARRVLEGNDYAAEVRGDERRAQMLGITGVPFFVFDEKFAVSGAQPSELFEEALARTWADSHPLVALVDESVNAYQDAGVCTDESCAI